MTAHKNPTRAMRYYSFYIALLEEIDSDRFWVETDSGDFFNAISNNDFIALIGKLLGVPPQKLRRAHVNNVKARLAEASVFYSTEKSTYTSKLTVCGNRGRYLVIDTSKAEAFHEDLMERLYCEMETAVFDPARPLY